LMAQDGLYRSLNEAQLHDEYRWREIIERRKRLAIRD